LPNQIQAQYLLYKYGCTFSVLLIWQYSYRIYIMATIQTAIMGMADSPTWGNVKAKIQDEKVGLKLIFILYIYLVAYPIDRSVCS